MAKRPTQNPPSGSLPPDAPTDAVKIFFARKLSELMRAKGWRGSETARRVTENAPPGVEISRSAISSYVLAKNLPTDIPLAAICKTFGVEPKDLLPSVGRPAAGKEDAFSVRKMDDGSVWLRVNQAVSYETAMKVMATLNEGEQ